MPGQDMACHVPTNRRGGVVGAQYATRVLILRPKTTPFDNPIPNLVTLKPKLRL